MKLLIYLFEPGEKKPFASGRYTRRNALAAALEKSAPWVHGFVIKSRLEIKGRAFEYALRVPAAPLILPSWKDHADQLADDIFRPAIRAARKVAPEIFPAQ